MSSANTVSTEQPSNRLENFLFEARQKLMLLMGLGTSAQKFQRVMHSNALGFFSFAREESDFVEGDGSFVFCIPQRGQDQFRMAVEGSPQLQLFWYLLESSMRGTLYRCVQYGLLVGALSTWVGIYNENARANFVSEPWTMKVGKHMLTIVSDFRMLPSLLLAFKVTGCISKWLSWLGYSGGISGRIGDLSLIIGSLESPENPDIRRVQFMFFRYLQAIHVLTYFQVDGRLPQTAYDMCRLLCRVGLLDSEEASRLLNAEQGGMHCTLLTWVSLLWLRQIADAKEGKVHKNTNSFMGKLMDLRGLIASLRCASEFNREPEVTDGLLHLVTYLLLFFVLVSYPFTFYTEDTGCFQPWACLSALVFYVTYDGLLSMQTLLQRSPFDVAGECVNVDNLLCGTEEMSFYMIRAAYAGDNLEGGAMPNRVAEHPTVFSPCSTSTSPVHVSAADDDGLAKPPDVEDAEVFWI